MTTELWSLGFYHAGLKFAVYQEQYKIKFFASAIQAQIYMVINTLEGEVAPAEILYEHRVYPPRGYIIRKLYIFKEEQ
jgi:hypothetical protein